MANPNTRTTNGMREDFFLKYSTANIPNSKDEDRIYCNLSHIEISHPDISSFAIFDGHGGSVAAEILHKYLHNVLLKKYSEIIKESVSASPECSRTDESKALIDFDHVICEAIKHTYKKVDSEIRRVSDHGSTAVSIFIKHNENGSKRVYCCWVGDSRCVMYQSTEIGNLSTHMSEDHKPTLRREKERIKRRLTPWRKIPFEVHRGSDSFEVDAQEEVRCFVWLYM